MITGAAAIMAAVFVSFAAAPIATVSQMGVGLTVAILLDATVVRIVLLPALMLLFGDRVWHTPRWLARLLTGADRCSLMVLDTQTYHRGGCEALESNTSKQTPNTSFTGMVLRRHRDGLDRTAIRGRDRVGARTRRRLARWRAADDRTRSADPRRIRVQSGEGLQAGGGRNPAGDEGRAGRRQGKPHPARHAQVRTGGEDLRPHDQDHLAGNRVPPPTSNA